MKVNRWTIGKLAGAVSSALLCLLVGVTVLAVALRYVLGTPLSWSEELSTLMMMWIIMIGAVFAKGKDGMLRMDIIFNVMPPRMQRCMAVLQELVHCLLFGMMTYFGYRLAVHAGAKTMPLLGVPMFWLYMALPVGAAGMLLMTLVRLWSDVDGQEEESWD